MATSNSPQPSILKPGFEELADETNAAAPVAPEPPPSIIVKTEPEPEPALPKIADEFVPRRPTTFEEAGLREELVEKLVSRYLYPRGCATGRKLAQHFGLPFRVLEGLLRRLKNEMILAYKRTAAVGDYEYVLTETGHERGRREVEMCSYADAAPVPLDDYVAGVAAQSLTNQRIGPDDLATAFADLLLPEHLLGRLGPALNSGRGMFIYGNPGNGKTSIAERVTRCFGSHVWIPRALDADGHIVRLYDPVIHEEAPLAVDVDSESGFDARWVRIVRPTVVVGGELTMEQLEVRHNAETNVSEASLQMKSNCGALVIDDFGRQRMPTAELLNRWIVPLEKRYDYVNLAGVKLQVPFDQLVIFSTNLEPRDLVDEAFLRRIPYKIEILGPNEEEYREIYRRVAPTMGFEANSEALDYLLQKHYKEANRELRACHPRDLLLQVRSLCMYNSLPLTVTTENIDRAVENYFSVM